MFRIEKLGVSPGDYVRVIWRSGKKAGDGINRVYRDKEGTVLQVTDKFVAIRCSSGYNLCVGLHHMKTGTKIEKVNTAKRAVC